MLSLQTENLINGFVEQSKEILQDNLVGVYLHGSSVMGCFNPEKSDIDLIVVVERPLPDPVKKEYLDMVVRYNAMGPGDRNEHCPPGGMQAVCLSHAV